MRRLLVAGLTLWSSGSGWKTRSAGGGRFALRCGRVTGGLGSLRLALTLAEMSFLACLRRAVPYWQSQSVWSRIDEPKRLRSILTKAQCDARFKLETAVSLLPPAIRIARRYNLAPAVCSGC